MIIDHLRKKPVKIEAKVVRHTRYVVFQMAEGMVSQDLSGAILEQVHRLTAVMT